jgi:predicted sulfurtransferase
MRHIFSFLIITVFALSVLTACQTANLTGKPETAKTDNKAAPTATAENKASKTNSTGHSDEHSDDAPRINLEEAKKAFDAGDVVFVDTRAEVAYKTEHVKGALNIPAEAFQMRYKEVPKGKKIIAYCS